MAKILRVPEELLPVIVTIIRAGLEASDSLEARQHWPSEMELELPASACDDVQAARNILTDWCNQYLG